MDQHAIEQVQADICKQYGQQFLSCPTDSILGVAVHTLGNHPIHGLRHKPAGNTNGWYIWSGEYSSASDFFSPLHTAHIHEKAPEVLNFLGLSPGCRFLLNKDYADVWFDSALLNS
jgi:hypothetical protein